MPSRSPEALARKYAKRRERCRVDPEYRRRRGGIYAIRRETAPFVGCDGEGIRDDAERSHYALFRMGTRELGPFNGDRRLTTPELLSFILDADPDAIHVGFAFNYDVSNILRDVPWQREGHYMSRLERVLRIDAATREGVANPFADKDFVRWTWLNYEGYPAFGVQYMPGNYFSVCLGVKDSEGFYRSKQGSIRTIYDVFGFFQSSFVRALDSWGIGKDLAEVQAMKERRDSFQRITRDIRRYCKLECELLAKLMEDFRAMCLLAQMVPRTWNGAGKLATALHNDYDTMKRKDVEAITQPGMLEMAQRAYYGGRFEVTRIGKFDQACWRHDIRSAYPTAMLSLPCLRHGRWKKVAGHVLQKLTQDREAIFVCPVGFEHPRDQFLCGLPLRSDGKITHAKGSLSWPRMGNGTYWSCEIGSAERLGARVECRAGWLYQRKCDCQMFRWVEEKYEYRRSIAKTEPTKGIPIKLAINSLYGKLAQRVGNPKFANPIWAGLITAITRARLNDAIAATDPQSVVMIATDGIFTVNKPIPGVKDGPKLGDWELKKFDGIFIVKPGLYWLSGGDDGEVELKSRGLGKKYFEPRMAAFEKAWADYMPHAGGMLASIGATHDVPVVPVTVNTFVGIRLAYRLGQPEKSCQWITRDVGVSFNWTDKRGPADILRGRKAIKLSALSGSMLARSMEYTTAQRQTWMDELDPDQLDTLLEAMPDPVDLSPPRK